MTFRFNLLKIIVLVSAVIFPFMGCAPGTSEPPVPFSVLENYIGIWDGQGGYTPFFVKGMNLGVAVPGTSPGELAVTREQYRRWIADMADAGVNSIRIYTLHFPRFYEELAAWNQAHADKPLYLFQGIWLEEDNPTLDLYNMTDGFDESIEEVIDCVHGKKEIPERIGKAYGKYTTDVSKWVMGFIIGREIIQDEVIATNIAHPADITYTGTSISLPLGTPTETWAAARLDHVATYELDGYGKQRPISLTNWPTLDPLVHPTEGTYRREDLVYIDLANIDTTKAPGGYFASYHAYPYYPDFMNEDPKYVNVTDSEGINNYLGYLLDLKNHYSKYPLIIAEFGVPSSWGNAHYSLSGMNHGGLDEETQGRYNARMIDNILNSNCGGGMLFEWMDEWWKRTWIVDPLAFPSTRYSIWHNVTSPEANFGLISFDAEAPMYSWPAVVGSGPVKELSAEMDENFFKLVFTLNRAPAPGEPVFIGIDTWRSDIGESVLPSTGTVADRSEFALMIDTSGDARLYVTQAYDLFGIWHWQSDPDQLYHSITTDGAPWSLVRWKNNDQHHSDDYKYVFPGTFQDIGILRMNLGGASTSLDAVIVNDAKITVLLPWTLIQFTDPSAMQVMNGDRATGQIRQSVLSDGIAFSILFDGGIMETQRFVWPGWNVPPATVEREKKSLQIFSDKLKSIPDFVE